MILSFLSLIMSFIRGNIENIKIEIKESKEHEFLSHLKLFFLFRFSLLLFNFSDSSLLEEEELLFLILF